MITLSVLLRIEGGFTRLFYFVYEIFAVKNEPNHRTASYKYNSGYIT